MLGEQRIVLKSLLESMDKCLGEPNGSKIDFIIDNAVAVVHCCEVSTIQSCRSNRTGQSTFYR